MSKTLLIQGTGLEFGWLLMRYNPYCRLKAQEGYDKVVVLCPMDERYIWEFATDFINTERPARCDRWFYDNGKSAKIPKKVQKAFPGADKVVPCEKICTKARYDFREFGSAKGFSEITSPYQLIIHARATKKYGQGNRNYSVKKFEAIVKEIGLAAASIGSKSGAKHIKGTDDLRGRGLKDVCMFIYQADVVIGPSSGPMHLAALCSVPAVVWTYKKYEKAIKANNRRRYQKLWNPFHSPVTVLDSWAWNPPVKEVVNAIRRYL